MSDEKLKNPSNDLDALLDDALNAFDNEDSIAARVPPAPAPSPANSATLDSYQPASASSSKPSKGGLAFDPLGGRGRKKPATAGTAAQGAEQGGHEEFTGGEDLEDVSAGLSQLLAELARANMGPGAEDAGPASSSEGGLGAGGAGLAETLRALAENQATFSGTEADEDNLENIPDDLLEKLAAQFQGMEGLEGLEGLLPPELLGGLGRGGGLGGGGAPRDPGAAPGGTAAPGAEQGEFPGMSSLVDTIMHQLLSKDVLYQPMKDIGSKYPEWLATNKESLDHEQYKQYEEQYDYIQKICTMYETDPENYPKLMDLLQEMQQRGQPPQEIIDELAPGMTFGPDGLPSIGGGGGGNSGLPGGMDPSECCIQ